jgi:hypothetical protein
VVGAALGTGEGLRRDILTANWTDLRRARTAVEIFHRPERRDGTMEDMEIMEDDGKKFSSVLFTFFMHFTVLLRRFFSP